MKLFKRRTKPARKSRRRNVLETLETRKLFAADLGSAPEDMLASPYAFVGDHSPSNSEKWSMQVGQTTLQASDFGEVERERLSLEKGKSYPISVSHIDTNIEEDGEKKPDYDYRAWIDDRASPAWTSGPSNPHSDQWFVQNPSGLLQKKFWGDDTNEATGSATLHIPLADLDIDSNNNGTFDENDDWIELDSRSGRLVDVLVGDRDEDGIEDRNDLNGIAGASFEPIKLSLSSNLSQAGSGVYEVTINYDMADANGNGGDFRLWKVDASQDRSSLSSLVRSGTTMSASSLGLNPGGSITLYLEAVNDTRNTVHFEKIDVDVHVSTSFFYGTLSDSVYAASVVPDDDAVPEIESLRYISDQGNQLIAISEGSFLPVEGIVKYRRQVQSVEVEVWADLDFDGTKDGGETRTVQATQTGDSDVNGDRYYEFSTSFYVADDGPSPGNLQGFDKLDVHATPKSGTVFESFIVAQNLAPTWVDYPELYMNFNEHGVVENSTVSGIFRDVGTQDRHAVQVFVNGTQRAYEEFDAGVVGFRVDLGILTPNDGDQIMVKLIDDDLGATEFYITLSSVISKSYIANIYANNGAGSVTSESPEHRDYAISATNRLLLFGLSTFAQFRENPSVYSEGDFRLYSRDIYSVGFDGTSVKYFEHLTDGSTLRAGNELLVYQGEIEERDRYRSLTSSTTGIAGVFVHGRPDPNLEGDFDYIMTRTSSDIWFKLDVSFTIQNNFADFVLVETDSSAFPSNRTWIDAEIESEYQQDMLVRLWQSSPSLGGTFVVGRDEEDGVFERQYYGQEDYWMPVTN